MSRRIVLVTGASRGIGRAIATAFAETGALVVGTATSGAGAETISARLHDAGTDGEGMVLDVTDSAACEQVVSAVTERHGAIGVLVNNAGITRDGLLMRMKDADWEAVIDTNLSSVYRMSRLAMKSMIRARSGRIVNIASVVGATGNAGQTNYAAAKAGLIGFTMSLAREIGSRGVTVNAIAPGFVESDMTDALDEKQRERLMQEIVLGRFGRPEEIAATCVFLASDAAAYITGQTLHVNGGMYMG